VVVGWVVLRCEERDMVVMMLEELEPAELKFL